MARLKKRRLGLAFSEEILRVKSSGRIGQEGREKGWEDLLLPNYKPQELNSTVSVWRLIAITTVFFLIFLGLFIRLFHLQIITGSDSRLLADSNRIQIRIIHAPRGVVYDRNGKVLAENNPGFRYKGNFVSRDEALSWEAQNDPRSDSVEIDTIRSYPLGPTTAHILGYVGEISPAELSDPKFGSVNTSSPVNPFSFFLDQLKGPVEGSGKTVIPYKPGDRVGRAGLEQIYEKQLRGVDGAEIIEVDAQGKKLRTIRKIDATPGSNLHLSIDADLQSVAAAALQKGVTAVGSCCGALVAENPLTGEILALASYPTFDSNAFTDPQKNSLVTGYFNDTNSPLLDRVIAGVYPPGSTFKISSALAGLYSGKITGQTQIEDTGVISLGSFQFSNWYFTDYGKTEGMVDIVKAIKRSNDIYFYRLGQQVGEKTLGETASKLGLGKKLGIDLPGESDGLIPTDQWKKDHVGEGWYPGDTLHMAIGQGFLLATPLQIMAQTSFIAADGKLYQPHLVTKVTDYKGNILQQLRFQPLVQNIFKKEDIDLVKTGMSEVPKDGGTAWPFFNFSIPTAGKTGTAEYGDPKNRTHAWYTSYAPFSDPQIATTVLIEGGGEGSNAAAPVVKETLTWYFNSDKAHIKSLDVYPVATASAKALGE